MTESVEARPILSAAETAAASNDYPSAERLLLEAAVVQERTLGPAHPDLANTLNNLGVVCERAGKVDDAEACYRRAHAIAIRAFPADHPFVATSRQNLEEFCTAHGRAIEIASPEMSVPVEQGDSAPDQQVAAGSVEQVAAGPIQQGPAYTAPSAASEPTTEGRRAAAPMRLQLDLGPIGDAGPAEQGPAYTAPQAAAAPTRTPQRPPVAQRVPDRPPSRALPLGALAVIGISFAIVLVGLIAWPRSNDAPPADSASPAAVAVEPAAPAEPRPAAPLAAAPPGATAPPARTAASDRESSTVSAGGLTITDARLCRTLSTRGHWECAPLGDPAAPGPMFFYTRIAAARPTKVQHRWYFGDRLEQSVTLDIQPNSGGFRTFSRRTANARRAGSWRVELRSQDGQLLREERFTVSQ